MSKTVLGECLFEEIDKLKQENKELKEKIDKAIKMLEYFGKYDDNEARIENTIHILKGE